MKKDFKYFWHIIAIVAVVFFSSCTKSKPAPAEEQAPAPVVSDQTPVQEEEPESEEDRPPLVMSEVQAVFLEDDMPIETLRAAIENSRVYLRKLPANRAFQYGETTYTTAEVIASMDLFEALLDNFNNKEQFLSDLNELFVIMKSPGGVPSNQVLFTGYYEPVLPGSRTKTSIYNIPAYAKPDDLLTLNLGNFRESLKERTIIYRFENGKIIPYFSRKEIMGGALEGKAKVVAYFRDPVDLFFMQIQGSGILRTESGEMIRIGYAGANGREYRSIGRLLIEKGVMTKDEASMQKIREYLRNNPSEVNPVLQHNESYTFFVEQDIARGPFGNINVPLTPERSIATDALLYPKAGLAFIATDVPNCDDLGQCSGTKRITRFVLNQDTGGAIKGPGRTDIFWGRGAKAEAAAGRMKYFGDVYFLVAKKSAISNVS